MLAVAGICDRAYTFPREMKKEEYQAKRKVFMDCCRHYKGQMKRRNRILMERSKYDEGHRNDIDAQLELVELQMLEENIQCVEETLASISKEYGKNAENLVYRVYVNGESIHIIAGETFMSEVTVKRHIKKYLERCL